MIKQKLLLVEDASKLSEPLERILFQNGYDVMLCDSLDSAAHLTDALIIRAVIVGKHFPEQEFRDFISTVKKQTPTPVVIVLSDFDDELEQLTVGVDDWIRKPCETRVLLAKLAVLCR